MENVMGQLIVALISGGAGGNIAGALFKKFSLGARWEHDRRPDRRRTRSAIAQCSRISSVNRTDGRYRRVSRRRRDLDDCCRTYQECNGREDRLTRARRWTPACLSSDRRRSLRASPWERFEETVASPEQFDPAV